MVLLICRLHNFELVRGKLATDSLEVLMLFDTQFHNSNRPADAAPSPALQNRWYALVAQVCTLHLNRLHYALITERKITIIF
jgi:hypothetical protein